MCHVSGHNKSKCSGNPCVDANICRLPEKHPELQNDIRELQKDLKELEKKYNHAKSDNEIFVASRQRAHSSFFHVMRPRLKRQNQPKYLDRHALDRDLQILQRALSNQIPPNEEMDWQLPFLIEQYGRNIDTYRSSFSTNTFSQMSSPPAPTSTQTGQIYNDNNYMQSNPFGFYPQ